MTRKIDGIIVDCVSREIFPGFLELKQGRIVRVGRNSGELCQHTQCRYILPGFTDAHIHIESSMLSVASFARAAFRHGTIATVSDPHEIANVIGIRGIDYMLESAAQTPLKFHFGAPSCVPATPFETAGAELGVRDITELLNRSDIKFLAEMMNYPCVIQRN